MDLKMNELVGPIENLKRSNIKNLVNIRLKEFSEFKKGTIDNIFKELCFCIMTANCSAEKCIEVHEAIGNDFLTLNKEHLARKFKTLGYRFPNLRANYIIESRKLKDLLEIELKNNDNGHDLRDWIVKNIKGLGYKESSHFLRNIGYNNYAIIDFHIIDLLVRHNLIEKQKTLTKKRYLEIETLLKKIANELNLTLAELDLYLWFLETGKILK